MQALLKWTLHQSWYTVIIHAQSMAALVLSFCTKAAIWGWLIKDFSFGTRSSRIICINTVTVFLAQDLAGSANQDALEELEPVWNTSQGPQRLYEQGGYMSKVGATGSSCGALTCLEDAGRCLMNFTNVAFSNLERGPNPSLAWRRRNSGLLQGYLNGDWLLNLSQKFSKRLWYFHARP